ncbi:hypothetical protein [Mycobacterium timonense]|uniref:hypothetical protein n=1 Tax=Mycobacterium timonense TaxID=701043 RepID=UPI001FCB39D3|nr:hypothetical protein [Mycobacterium timonense]
MGGVLYATGELLQNRAFVSSPAVPNDCASLGEMKSGSLRGCGQVARDRRDGQCQRLLVFADGDVGVQKPHIGHGPVAVLV